MSLSVGPSPQRSLASFLGIPISREWLHLRPCPEILRNSPFSTISIVRPRNRYGKWKIEISNLRHLSIEVVDLPFCCCCCGIFQFLTEIEFEQKKRMEEKFEDIYRIYWWKMEKNPFWPRSWWWFSHNASNSLSLSSIWNYFYFPLLEFLCALSTAGGAPTLTLLRIYFRSGCCESLNILSSRP